MSEERRSPSRNEDVLHALYEIDKKLDAHMLKEEPVLHRAEVNMDRAEQGIIEVGAPGGWKGKLTGIDTKLVLLALLILASAWGIFLLWQESQRTEQSNRAVYLEQHKVTQALLATVIANTKATITVVQEAQRKNSEEVSELSYIQTLSPKQREGLKLDMPPSLRQKLNNSR